MSPLNLYLSPVEPGQQESSVGKSACLLLLYIYYQVYILYLFVIFYLKFSYITACLRVKTNMKDHAHYCGSFVPPNANMSIHFYSSLFVAVFIFGSMFMMLCKKRQQRGCLCTWKGKNDNSHRKFPRDNSPSWFTIRLRGSNINIHIEPVWLNF